MSEQGNIEWKLRRVGVQVEGPCVFMGAMVSQLPHAFATKCAAIGLSEKPIQHQANQQRYER